MWSTLRSESQVLLKLIVPGRGAEQVMGQQPALGIELVPLLLRQVIERPVINRCVLNQAPLYSVGNRDIATLPISATPSFLNLVEAKYSAKPSWYQIG